MIWYGSHLPQIVNDFLNFTNNDIQIVTRVTKTKIIQFSTTQLLDDVLHDLSTQSGSTLYRICHFLYQLKTINFKRPVSQHDQINFLNSFFYLLENNRRLSRSTSYISSYDHDHSVNFVIHYVRSKANTIRQVYSLSSSFQMNARTSLFTIIPHSLMTRQKKKSVANQLTQIYTLLNYPPSLESRRNLVSCIRY